MRGLYETENLAKELLNLEPSEPTNLQKVTSNTMRQVSQGFVNSNTDTTVLDMIDIKARTSYKAKEQGTHV